MLTDGPWKSTAGAIWVPDGHDVLQLRLCIIAHTSVAMHRFREATKIVLSQHFFWSMLSTDVRSFVQSCIQCLSTTGGPRASLLLRPAVHSVKLNDLLQLDSLQLGPGSIGQKYELFLHDDHPGCC